MSWRDFRHWFAEQPFTTKWITVLSLALPLLMRLQVISPHWLVWHWESISRRAQVWRMLTAPFLTRVNFNFIIALYFRFQYSLYLETGYFAGRPADYAYFVLLSTLLINVHMPDSSMAEGPLSLTHSLPLSFSRINNMYVDGQLFYWYGDSVGVFLDGHCIRVGS